MPCRLQQYAELLSSPHPQYVLQALNLLLAISRRDGHAQVLAHNPALVKALCSVVHAFHLVIDAALAQRAAPADAAAAALPLQDVRRALVEGPWCGEACEAQAWRAQLAVHAGTVIHNLVQVCNSRAAAQTAGADVWGGASRAWLLTHAWGAAALKRLLGSVSWAQQKPGCHKSGRGCCGLRESGVSVAKSTEASTLCATDTG